MLHDLRCLDVPESSGSGAYRRNITLLYRSLLLGGATGGERKGVELCELQLCYQVSVPLLDYLLQPTMQC